MNKGCGSSGAGTRIQVMSVTKKFVDVSHTVEHGLVTYRGLPAPVICDSLSHEESRRHYAEGTEFQIGKIEMVANTGTYLDSPFHRYEDGKELSQLALESPADLHGVGVNAALSAGRSLGREAFDGREVNGKGVLVRTGWDAHWRTERYF